MAKLLEHLDCATTKLGEKSVNGRCHEYPGMVKRSLATTSLEILNVEYESMKR